MGGDAGCSHNNETALEWEAVQANIFNLIIYYLVVNLSVFMDKQMHLSYIGIAVASAIV